MDFSLIEYDQINHLQVGRIGEYIVKLDLTLLGFDVYTTEVDDKGIDFVIRGKNSEFIEIQVKTIRKEKTNYVFVTKETWRNILRENLFLALVVLQNQKAPELYLIQATEWMNENELLRDRNYDGENQKSKPEWGINISNKNMGLLEKYKIENQYFKLKMPVANNA